MRILAVSVALIACLVIPSRAQGPFCPYQEFPYTFCGSNGEFVVKCSTDPHREQGLKPVRVEEPPCMIPAQIYQKTIQMGALPGPQIIDVYDPLQGLKDMNAAFAEWTSHCPDMGGAPGNMYCCFKVYMSESEFDFSSPVSDLEGAGISLYISNWKACRAECSFPPELHINFTDKFLYRGTDPESSPVVRAWFSGTDSPIGDVEEIQGTVIGFRQFITWKFGTMMGLKSRTGDNPTGCDNHGTVMGNYESPYDYEGLTDEDICQFVKLYCPERAGMEPASGVDKEDGVTGITLSQNVPNPFSALTAIPYSLPDAGHVRLSLFNAIGKEVKSLIDQYTEAGSYTFGFRADDDMPPGTYWYVLRVDDVTRVRQMVLVR